MFIINLISLFVGTVTLLVLVIIFMLILKIFLGKDKIGKIRYFRYRIYELYKLYKLKLGLEERGTSVKELLALEEWFDEIQRPSLQEVDRFWVEEQKKLDDYVDDIVDEKNNKNKKKSKN